MPKISAADGTKLYVEEVGAGTPVVFVHEYAGDYRSFEPQLRHFCRRYRCVSYSQRGYPPSDVPPEAARYSQDIARDDVIAVMDALSIDKAHIVGHSMGAYTALRIFDADVQREAMRALAAETGKMFAEEGIAAAAAKYADAPMRQAFKHKDPRGFAEFARMLSEHSAEGHAQTMLNLQLKRPTLWDMEAQLKKFSLPLLVIVGDEDDLCLDGSVFLKRTVPTAALLVVPRAGHTINSEEPAAFNAALAELFAAVDAGRWMAHKGA